MQKIKRTTKAKQQDQLNTPEYYLHVCMHVCAFECECVCVDAYKHLRGIGLRKTGTGCNNVAPLCCIRSYSCLSCPGSLGVKTVKWMAAVQKCVEND